MKTVPAKYLSQSLLACLSLAVCSCSPIGGPDKTVTGAVLGAGWGAGAGAVIGNQTNNTGEGAAIGSGFGLVSGAISGAGLDVLEETEIEQQRELDALKVQVSANNRRLARLQHNLDQRDTKIHSRPEGASVYFDSGKSVLSGGALAQLERLADAIKSNPYVGGVELHAYSTDAAMAALNQELSEQRAEAVANVLVAHGVSRNKIDSFSHGAENMASNEQSSRLNQRVEVVFRK